MPELLPIYYKKLFPFTQYFKWLRYKESGPNYFKNREFSFTLKDDIYLRYRSYADQAEMEKDIRSKCPYKIDRYWCSIHVFSMYSNSFFVKPKPCPTVTNSKSNSNSKNKLDKSKS